MLAIAAAEASGRCLHREIASKYGLNVIPEEWGAVAPMPDAVKIAIEAGREPLPVEPEEAPCDGGRRRDAGLVERGRCACRKDEDGSGYYARRWRRI